MTVVMLLLLSSLAAAEYKKTDFLIRPRSLNRRGVTGPGRVCPENAFAVGFKLKVRDSPTRHRSGRISSLF